MKIETKFDVGQTVRVVKDGNFIGLITDIRVSVNEVETFIGYTVTLPLEKRGHGRNYMETWGYREDWLESVD
jgi:hypothetical protein